MLQDISTSGGHPFIVSLHFAFQDVGHLYLVLDFVGGGDLFTLLEVKQQLPEHWVQVYAGEIVLALLHVHRLGIIFRDLKPENVMVEMDAPNPSPDPGPDPSPSPNPSRNLEEDVRLDGSERGSQLGRGQRRCPRRGPALASALGLALGLALAAALDRSDAHTLAQAVALELTGARGGAAPLIAAASDESVGVAVAGGIAVAAAPPG